MKTRRLCLPMAVLTGMLVLAAGSGAMAGAKPDKRPSAPPASEAALVRFDRAGFAEEMSRLSGDLKGHPTEALQGHAQRLTELYASLEAATDLSPSERQTVGEGILGRLAQVGLVLRQRQEGRLGEEAGRGRRGGWVERFPRLESLGATLFDGPALLLGLVGGVIIAFALGSLTGYRRGTSQASYYGSVGDPRIRFLAKAAGQRDEGSGSSPVTVTQLRDVLANGRMVMLQLGYEIKPDVRPRYLDLIAKMQVSMGPVDGQSYSVWEDPRHPNRFYELLVCYRPAALERLMGRDWRLAEIAGEIEGCRAPNGPVFRRAWWALPPAKLLTPPSEMLRED